MAVSNLGLFFRSFLGFLITLILIVVIAGIGFLIGYNVRKAVDKKKGASETVSESTDNKEGSN